MCLPAAITLFAFMWSQNIQCTGKMSVITSKTLWSKVLQNREKLKEKLNILAKQILSVKIGTAASYDEIDFLNNWFLNDIIRKDIGPFH